MLPSHLLTIGAGFEKGLAAADRGDFATALTEWRPIAEQGHADTQLNLGLMYGLGAGVPLDRKVAAKWITAAAEQGHVFAQYLLGEMYTNGQGVLQDDIQAQMWWNIAAANGDKDAARRRDHVAKKMAASQIQEAQQLAREWVAAH